MGAVEADSPSHDPNIGHGHSLGPEQDLGVQVWRRHISPGLVSHMQASRIWRQATEIGQVPLVKHITDRLGTGNSDFRTWDSVPFVIGRRTTRIQARTIPEANSSTVNPDIQPQPEVPATLSSDSQAPLKRQVRGVSTDAVLLLHASQPVTSSGDLSSPSGARILSDSAQGALAPDLPGEDRNEISAGADKDHEESATIRKTQDIHSPTGQDILLLKRQSQATACSPPSLVLQPPILRRSSKGNAQTVSSEPDIGDQSVKRMTDQVWNASLEHGPSFPHLQHAGRKDHGSDVSNVSTGDARQNQEPMLRQAQSQGSSWGHSVATADSPTPVLKVQRIINRDAHVEASTDLPSNHAHSHKVPSALGDTLRDSLKTHDSFSARTASGPSPALPHVQATGRSLSGSQSPAVIWRSPIPGMSTDARSLDGVSGYRTALGSTDRASLPFLARQVANPVSSQFPRPDTSSMHELSAMTESRKASPSANLGELAEQVSRFLTRQLVVERERRGVSP